MSVNPIAGSLAGNLDSQFAAKGAKSQAEEPFSLDGTKQPRALESSKKADKSSESFDFFKQLQKKVDGYRDKPGVTEMQERLSQIRQKGRALLEHPYPKLVDDYIGSVKSFLNDVSEHGYEAEKRSNLFQKIKVVDEKLDNLAKDFLENNKREIEIVNSLGELEGLLVDILV